MPTCQTPFRQECPLVSGWVPHWPILCRFVFLVCLLVCPCANWVFFFLIFFIYFEQRYLQSSYVEACHGLWRRPDLPVPDISFFVYTEIHKSFLSLCSVLCCHRTWVTEEETWVTRHSYTPMKLRFVKSSCSLWRSFQKTHHRQRMNPWVSIWHDWSLLYAFYSEEDVCVCVCVGGGGVIIDGVLYQPSIWT